MKKNIAKYACYFTLTTGVLMTVLFSSVACSGPEIPKMTVSYGPEIGFADGRVNLSDTSPIINISDIKAEVGMNIDYLSGVIVKNEDEFEDLEIRVDASMVDIFTPGNYKVTYTFLFNNNLVTKDITVTLFENEQSASDSNVPNTEKISADSTTKHTNSNNTGNSETSTTLSGNNEKPTNNNSGTTKPTATTSNNTGTTKPEPTTSKNFDTTKPTPTTSNNSGTTKPVPSTSDNSGTTKPVPSTSSNSGTTKPITTTSNNDISTTEPTATTSNNSGSETPDSTSTTREIITTSGNITTESKNIGNYTIELLSGKTITIKNTTKRYIVSTRTDVEIVEEKGYTYRISKLIITYNTGLGQVLETIKDRIK